MKTRVESAEVGTLAEQLAAAASIEPAEAQRVLDVLGVSKLVQAVNTQAELLSNPDVVNALNISHSDAQERLRACSPEGFRLDNLRLAIKPTQQASIAA
jgi:hypothetical protein